MYGCKRFHGVRTLTVNVRHFRYDNYAGEEENLINHWEEKQEQKREEEKREQERIIEKKIKKIRKKQKQREKKKKAWQRKCYFRLNHFFTLQLKTLHFLIPPPQ